jgi:hypothetical protein
VSLSISSWHLISMWTACVKLAIFIFEHCVTWDPLCQTRSRKLLRAASSALGLITATHYLKEFQNRIKKNSNGFKTLLRVSSFVEENMTTFHQRSPTYTGCRSSNASLSNFQFWLSTSSETTNRRIYVNFCATMNQSAVCVLPLKNSFVLIAAELFLARVLSDTRPPKLGIICQKLFVLVTVY